MGIREDFAEYTDGFGYVSGRWHPPTPDGNSLMFTAEKILILRDKKMLTTRDTLEYFALVDRFNTIKMGHLRRTPPGHQFSGDTTRWDDYVGVLLASLIADNDVAMEIVMFGESSHYVPFSWAPWLRFPWYFPGEAADYPRNEWNAWFGRSPAFVAHAYWCAGLRPSWWTQLCYAIATGTTGILKPLGQDNWRMSYLMIRARQLEATPFTPKGFLGLPALAERIWWRRLKKYWPGGIRAVRARYFDNNPNHPLSVYCDD